MCNLHSDEKKPKPNSMSFMLKERRKNGRKKLKERKETKINYNTKH